jgi:hypothetical protein
MQVIHWLQDNKRPVVMAVSLVLALAVGLILGFFLNAWAAEGEEMSVSQSSVTLSPYAKVVYRYTYAPCGHMLKQEEPIPREWAGLTEEGLRETAGRAAAYFSADQVIVDERLNLYCPEHFVLKEENGQLQIYQNADGKGVQIIHTLNTPVDALPENVRASLRQGIAFDSLEELESYIESLES